jgi:hypothetical protein
MRMDDCSPVPLLLSVDWSTVTVRQEIGRQRRLDRKRSLNLALIGTRVRAIAEAQRAVAADEPGALPALRQGLIDLGAACEALAGDLEPETP